MPLHLTDRELLRGLDDELSESRKVAAERHLRECETCRRRQVAIHQTAMATSSTYREVSGADETMNASRDRLKAHLSQAVLDGAARQWSDSGAGHGMFSRRALSGALALAAMVAWLAVSIASGGFGILPADPGSSLPMASITPGATWDVSAEDLCAGTRYTRTITTAMRAQVVSAYGVAHVPADQYELDYLITPELGGATDARNLWPQPYASRVWNARVKDELERLLPRLVCAGALDLETAQRDMAVDWIAAYKKYFNTDQPLQAHRGPAPGEDDDEVHVLADARRPPAVRLVSADRWSVRALRSF
jgi:anti-sigma factor RsiW